MVLKQQDIIRPIYSKYIVFVNNMLLKVTALKD